jgi:hypothetical protein
MEQMLAAGREGRGHRAPEYSVASRTAEELSALRSKPKVPGLGRPEAASTHLNTAALTAAERTTLTAIAAALAAELLRAERVHVSPVWQLGNGVSSTDAARDVDRVRRQAREELRKAATERV